MPNKPTICALKLAISCLDRERQNYRARKDSARYGLRTGIIAQEHYDEHTRALEILEAILREEEDQAK